MTKQKNLHSNQILTNKDLRKFINSHELLMQSAFDKINKDLRPENKSVKKFNKNEN